MDVDIEEADLVKVVTNMEHLQERGAVVVTMDQVVLDEFVGFDVLHIIKVMYYLHFGRLQQW